MTYEDQNLNDPTINNQQPCFLVIETIRIKKSKSWDHYCFCNKVIVFLEGSGYISYPQKPRICWSKGQFLFIATGNNILCEANNDALLLVFNIKDQIRFNKDYTFKHLYKESGHKVNDSELTEEIYLQDVHPNLWSYFTGLLAIAKKGGYNEYYYELKMKEFFYLLGVYYSKVELIKIFQTTISKDSVFYNQVKSNYYKYKTASEMAHAMNYSLSGFYKRFKAVFGMPIYRWMNEQKAASIYRELYTSERALKHLAFKYGFSSVASFNDFCKKHFNKTPMEIRNSGK